MKLLTVGKLSRGIWTSPSNSAGSGAPNRSSDRCRALVSDDENDKAVSSDAFELVAAIAGKRLKNRRLTVIDATLVRAADRKAWAPPLRTAQGRVRYIILDRKLKRTTSVPDTISNTI